LGLSIYTIRFYDKEGLLPFVSRNKSGNREFTESDLNLFKMICCLKKTGVQIKDIKKYIDLCMKGAGTNQVKALTLIERSFIIEYMRYKDDNKKEKIIMVAIQLINEVGLAEISMSKIAKKAGVSAGTIYEHIVVGRPDRPCQQPQTD